MFWENHRPLGNKHFSGREVRERQPQIFRLRFAALNMTSAFAIVGVSPAQWCNIKSVDRGRAACNSTGPRQFSYRRRKCIPPAMHRLTAGRLRDAPLQNKSSHFADNYPQMAHAKYRRAPGRTPGHPRSLGKENYTPGQNKYFCGNLQMITWFCETLSGPCSKPPHPGPKQDL